MPRRSRALLSRLTSPFRLRLEGVACRAARVTHLRRERDALCHVRATKCIRNTAWRLGGALVAFLSAQSTAVTWAHAQTGTIAGTVTDRAGNAPVPAAQVQIIGTTRGR